MKNFLNFYYPDEEAASSYFVPKTRKQKYIGAIAGVYEGELPEPKTVDEHMLYAIAGRSGGEGSPAPGGLVVDTGGSNAS